MGAELLKDPDNAEKIMIASVKAAREHGLSISCKIRILPEWQKTIEYVRRMQATGIDWITVHPRTKEEMSKPPA